MLFVVVVVVDVVVRGTVNVLLVDVDCLVVVDTTVDIGKVVVADNDGADVNDMSMKSSVCNAVYS